MPHDRFYIDEHVVAGQTVVLEGAEMRHLKVMRIKAGDALELVNGKGQLGRGRVGAVKRGHAELEMEEVEENKEPKPHLILAQALPRPNRLDLILEKGTELGASAFWLFPGEQSERKSLSASQWERAKKITIAAMKQSGRLYLPKIEQRPPLAEWTSFPAGLFGDLRQSAPWLKEALPQGDEVAFFVGPEAGFSDAEIETLKKGGIRGVKLHEFILRTDTAPIVALALLSHLL